VQHYGTTLSIHPTSGSCNVVSGWGKWLQYYTLGSVIKMFM